MMKFFAPANIALIKYWGKRDKILNLPMNSSLSISLGKLGSYTEIQSATEDRIFFNQKLLENHEPFAEKIWQFLDLLVPNRREKVAIFTENTIPTAAGLASSASGFAALTLAINDFFKLQLNTKQMSIFARRGSGSATRSLWSGFVKWNAGNLSDGSDSYGEQLGDAVLNNDWKNLRIALLPIDLTTKKISSREGMNHTVKTSPLYELWQKTAENDLKIVKNAIFERDFVTLGKTAEANALAMHATMLSAREALCYWQPQTLLFLQQLWKLRAEGLNAYATIDAGPNIKLLFLIENLNDVRTAFPQCIVISPFEN